ncbi:FMRFamide-related peptides [Osmia lignaria lignaria]|uniref:FMRFamide-related peptides n=1 Tax=Osmia lignaria lignaria TaxID=1437193 RepID=UPI00402BEBB1
MTLLSSLYVLPFLCNYVLVSSSILTPLKADGSLRIFKDPSSDFDYVLKRHSNGDGRSEDSDLKERRSNPGSSFIRYGRSDPDGNVEKILNGDDGSSKVNRYPRWKSPDIVIRFGRSGFRTMNSDREYKRGRNDLNFIRYGRNVQVYPLEIDMTSVCSDLLSNEESKDNYPYETRLLRLCNILNNIDADHRNSLDFLEERIDSKHD